jgi:hypothetical protein
MASERDWVMCRVSDGKFLGHGGPLALGLILRAFLDWARQEQGRARQDTV